MLRLHYLGDLAHGEDGSGKAAESKYSPPPLQPSHLLQRQLCPSMRSAHNWTAPTPICVVKPCSGGMNDEHDLFCNFGHVDRSGKSGEADTQAVYRPIAQVTICTVGLNNVVTLGKVREVADCQKLGSEVRGRVQVVLEQLPQR